jgi:hypothetical protein
MGQICHSTITALTVVGWGEESVNWSHLAQHRNQCSDLVNMVMGIHIPQNAWISSLSWAAVCFPRRTLVHKVSELFKAMWSHTCFVCSLTESKRICHERYCTNLFHTECLAMFITSLHTKRHIPKFNGLLVSAAKCWNEHFLMVAKSLFYIQHKMLSRILHILLKMYYPTVRSLVITPTSQVCTSTMLILLTAENYNILR